jgi:cardiolipin synthase
VSGDIPTNGSDGRQRRGLSQFAQQLVDDLAVDHYRLPAWRRFIRRALRRSRENLSASRRRTRAFLVWAVLGAILGSGLLVLRWHLSDSGGPPLGHALAWAGWYLVATTWALLHLGLADERDGRPAVGFGVPNGLSFLRLGLAPVAVALSAVGPVTEPDPLPAVLIAALVVTDVLDGQLARALERVSRFGRVIDPLADVVFLTALTIAVQRAGLLPPLLLALVLIRFPFAFAMSIFVLLTRGPFHIAPTVLGRITVVLLYAVFLATLASHHRVLPWPPAEWISWAMWVVCLPLAVNIVWMYRHGTKLLRR